MHRNPARVSALVSLSLALAASLILAACGGGGSSDDGSSSGGSSSGTVTGTNTMAITVDGGPAALVAAKGSAVNIPYVSLTVCTPGSTTACVTIDHVLVDTGSSGLRLIKSALGSGVTATTSTASNGRALQECAVFADGYTWGPVVTLDVQLGSATAASVPVNLIDDSPAYTAPSACSSSGPDENSVTSFGANGVLGVGNFAQDCGSGCASSGQSGWYYTCSSTSACSAVAVALANQVTNPVTLLASDNNGVVVSMGSVASGGAASARGTLVFGLGTRSNNTLGSATLYALDASAGTLGTTYEGTYLSGSFFDTGSNGLYFDAGDLSRCSGSYADFYCPTSTQTRSATVRGQNGASTSISFQVGNAQTYLSDSSITAYAGLAGTHAETGAFDWGLPFFYGREVGVLFETGSLDGAAGPAVVF